MIKCEICTLPKTESHVCPPKWIIYTADNPDDSRVYFDHNPDIAAEMFIDDMEEEDKYSFADGGGRIVVEGSNGKRFEFEPRYQETITWFMDEVY